MPTQKRRRRRPPTKSDSPQITTPPSTALRRIPPTTYESDEEDEALETLGGLVDVSGGSITAMLRVEWMVIRNQFSRRVPRRKP